MKHSAKIIGILEDLVCLHDRVFDLSEHEKESLGKLLDNVYVAIVEGGPASESERVPESLSDLALSTVDLFQGLRLVLDPSYDFQHFNL